MENLAYCKQKYKTLPASQRNFIPAYFAWFDEHHHIPRPIYNLEQSRRHLDTVGICDALGYVHTTIYQLLSRILPVPKQQNSRNDDMPTMIQFKLNADELAQYDAWVAQKGFNFDVRTTNHLIDGYKLGVSWDGYNDCFIASSTGKAKENRNTGLCLLSRSTDWKEALALNLFKSEVVYANGIWRPRKDDVQRG